MNYRHAYHAGNHADVLKHAVLCRLLTLMGRKETPLASLDTHAGIGLYDLNSQEAGKTGEWREGIGRLWTVPDLPPLLAEYRHLVAALNPQGTLRYYPGSPEIARRLTRPQDRVLLNEKHPEDGEKLRENMRADRRVRVHLGEGWHVARALLPVVEKRALLLIDPPFEQADELAQCVESLKTAIARMRQTVVVIWYPIKDERQLKRFYQALAASGAPKLLRAELSVHPTDNPAGLNGSGLAIVNPPWPLADELQTVLPFLARELAQSKGGWRLDWLIEEKTAG
ncbi:MAG: 23S rRNA (adenine(2030)-N(6))-methyltransferase RlmJ [Pseudomonas sp.]